MTINKKNLSLNIVALLIIVLFLTGCPSNKDKTKKGPDPSDIEANNRGVALMRQYDFDGANKIFAGLSSKYPGNLEMTTNLAISIINRQEEGDEQAALHLLEKVLTADKNNVRASYCAGLLELHMGRPEKALEYIKSVLESDPADGEALYFVGKALTQLSRYEEAVDTFKKALKADPYMSSAYYGMIMAMRQSGKTSEAMSMIEEYSRIKDNPRVRIVEFKYTKMGGKAEAMTINRKDETPSKKPSGPLFKGAKPLSLTKELQWKQPSQRADSRYGGITVSDLNADGFPDIFMPGAVEGGNALLLGTPDPERYSPATDHPLAGVSHVNSALWGDVDDDGLIDVYLCRKGENQLWRQNKKGEWVDVTKITKTGGGNLNTVDGALFDADHDGDLDIFLVNSDGSNELLNNDRNGAFRPLAAKYGLEGKKTSSRQIAIADLDKDRDADIIIINDEAPHEVYINDRLWKYHSSESFGLFEKSDVKAIVPGDLDSDGRPELYALDSKGTISRWEKTPEDEWKMSVIRDGTSDGKRNDSSFSHLELADFDGDGTIDILASTHSEWQILTFRNGSPEFLFDGSGDGEPIKPPGSAPSLALINTPEGPALLSPRPGSKPEIHLPGEGRFSFVSMQLLGRKDPDSNLRSNSSGIGAYLSARTESRWTITDTFHKASGPGQGMQPVLLGLGGAGKIDFVSIDWPDGVFQTELDLLPDKTIKVAETERQMSSCPVLFAWNGEKFEFVSDILGVGGIGYAVGPGIYAEPRPHENFIFPPEALKPRDGKLLIKMTEPMEEVEYLDAARLKAYDLPPGWHMTLDERMGIGGPAPTGEAIFYRKMLLPLKAVNDRNEDVTGKVTERDMAAAPAGELDRRFIGRLEEDHVLTLTFEEALDRIAGDPTLVIDGWVEYPYSQTSFAAWQAGAEYRAPTVEAQTLDGEWIVVLDQFGYPAGMPRQMSVALPNLPAGAKRLRISTNQEVYWDRIAVAFAEPCPQAKVHKLELESARLEETGFPLRTDLAQRRPHYDYSKRSPLWDTRRLEGHYTRFGDVMELLEKADNALALIGPGEGVHMEFKEPIEPVPGGWTRRYVIETEGWCKDMDLFTNTGEKVGPLPHRGEVGEEAERLNGKYNTRYLSGRM